MNSEQQDSLLKKRVGDAVILSGLSLYQQGIAASSLLATTELNLGSAVIRGCRITICLFVCEKLFKLLRAPTSVREVPVPVEAAGLAMCVNLALEYNIAALGTEFNPIPRTLALSLGGTTADGAAAYLTIVVWRILYASMGL